MEARYLEADCLEQIGYAKESGIRQNFILTGSQELRHGKKVYLESDLDESFLLEMPLGIMLQSLEIKIDPTMAEQSDGLSLNLEVKDTNEKFNIIISHAVLISPPVDVLPTTARATIIVDSKKAMINVLSTGDTSGVAITGDKAAFAELMGCVSTMSDGTWNIIEPREHYVPKPQATYPQSQTLASTAEPVSCPTSEDLSTGAWVGICFACALIGASLGAMTMKCLSKNSKFSSESTTKLDDISQVDVHTYSQSHSAHDKHPNQREIGTTMRYHFPAICWVLLVQLLSRRVLAQNALHINKQSDQVRLKEATQDDDVAADTNNACNSAVGVRKVAVIGAGMGGSAASYFLKRLPATQEATQSCTRSSPQLVHTTVFEATDTIGGRAAIKDFNGYHVEIGGSVFHQSNRFMMAWCDEFGLERQKGFSSDDGSDSTVGVWDGDTVEGRYYGTCTLEIRIESFADAKFSGSYG
ncbi:hypothetical protein SARC_06339 [Sphaeroforma arctica JP610]|uniref:Alkyl sulfatase C-terminal domain-containing protein n=1 Tax=Sphaeroforma arctica JP610 TaxID=667725 RepID=A0A0L0FWV0_9EUKA|nr:hypothetical protein SARC_06339 [Sphaeroforma arctica JP610]KNC81320.1 hypothetical protein SARC_06339 [Sphaeroforma arctica JP610]|eukprot:XP_014155222.1 hypothetical protein SARC_06339 [Sphaeroforma arctica JP610]